MVHGYHLILGAYGFWLPNDPRGSWSDFVGKWELVRFGRTTKSLERRSLLDLTPEELAEREVQRQSLKYPPVQLTGVQALAVGQGFAAKSREFQLHNLGMRDSAGTHSFGTGSPHL